jgi:hypothetical protein
MAKPRRYPRRRAKAERDSDTHHRHGKAGERRDDQRRRHLDPDFWRGCLEHDPGCALEQGTRTRADLNEQGYRADRVEPNLFWVTDGVSLRLDKGRATGASLNTRPPGPAAAGPGAGGACLAGRHGDR